MSQQERQRQRRAAKKASGEMSEHTPGPWLITEEPDGWDARYATFRLNTEDDGSPEASLCDISEWNHPRARADAHLIAAAPDLLAALRDMCSLVAGTSAVDEQPYRDACAAIRKAEGQEAAKKGSEAAPATPDKGRGL